MTKTFKDYLQEAETSESGLQYYTGVKKHGKEYMKKAAKAGREGASQEELGRLKDKYSKAEKTKEDFGLDRIKELSGISLDEETYDGDDFDEAYGDMWYNDDEVVDEAEYQGRKVKLGKPMRGDVKKFKVYVKNPKGNIVKVNFGDPDMKIKKSNPARRRSFRARHNCDNPGPRHKARYWSCRKW